MFKNIIFKNNIFKNPGVYLGLSETSMQHLFYSQFIDTEILRKLSGIESQFDKEIFMRHNLLNNDIYLAFVRRCNRLLDLIDNNNKIVFVYYNCYTTDFNDILDFHNNFSNNKNIFVLGIFENSGDKKILFENSNCKIYQNYDRNFIFNEIKNNF